MRQTTILTFAALISGAAIVHAQNIHAGATNGMDHADHDRVRPVAATELTEPGQGAFAALSEVVRVLETDPDTDWSKVDLVGLRAHLIDMERLVSDTVAVETQLPDGLRILATGNSETIVTLGRMVPAHAAQLATDDRWVVKTRKTDNGVELQVTSDDPSVVTRIKGLGFFGLMASQNHHQEHHLMIARGQNAHRH